MSNLNSMLQKCRLYKGHNIQNITQFFNQEALNKIQNSKEITILKKNKEYFTKD